MERPRAFVTRNVLLLSADIGRLSVHSGRRSGVLSILIEDRGALVTAGRKAQEQEQWEGTSISIHMGRS